MWTPYFIAGVIGISFLAWLVVWSCLYMWERQDAEREE